MQILEFMHVLQNKVAYVRVKMKDVRTGTVTETALKGSDSSFKRCYIDMVIAIHLWIVKLTNKLIFLVKD